MIGVRFMSLVGKKFSVVREQEFSTESEALEAVKAYAEASDFSDVKPVDDPEDYGSIRYTARTPGGRHGRNVAFGDYRD